MSEIYVCVYFISIAAFLSIYDPKKYQFLKPKKMYNSMNKFLINYLERS